MPQVFNINEEELEHGIHTLIQSPLGHIFSNIKSNAEPKHPAHMGNCAIIGSHAFVADKKYKKDLRMYFQKNYKQQIFVKNENNTWCSFSIGMSSK